MKTREKKTNKQTNQQQTLNIKSNFSDDVNGWKMKQTKNYAYIFKHEIWLYITTIIINNYYYYMS